MHTGLIRMDPAGRKRMIGRHDTTWPLRALAVAAATVGIAGLLAGCAGAPADESPGTGGSQPERYDGAWVLTGIDGVPDDVPGIGEVEGPADAPLVTLLIDGTAVSGSGGCNSYSGELAGPPGTFEIRRITHTEIACMDAGAQALEDFYFESLTTIVSADLSGEILTLTADSGAILTFERTGRAPDLDGE